MQLWVSLWDSRYVNSHYVKFEEFFVKPIMGDAHKQTFLPGTLEFGDFRIVSTRAYEAIDRKLVDEYNLLLHTPRKNHDPEGYIHMCRKGQALKGYLHCTDDMEDLCKNKEVEELADVMKNLERRLRDKKQRLEDLQGEEEEYA